MNIKTCKIFISILVGVLISGGIISLGCSRKTSNDMAQLKNLENFYGREYHFAFSQDVYIEARLKKKRDISEAEALKIYDLFFVDSVTKLPRKTSYTYLNFWDSKQKFVFQLYFDPKEGRIVFERRVSHY